MKKGTLKATEHDKYEQYCRLGRQSVKVTVGHITYDILFSISRDYTSHMISLFCKQILRWPSYQWVLSKMSLTVHRSNDQ
jgi:hypothetical protein